MSGALTDILYTVWRVIFRGVLIVVIFVVDRAVMKFPLRKLMTTNMHTRWIGCDGAWQSRKLKPGN